MSNQEVIYVFGYGSLTWKPDFESHRQFVGYVRGYERRFWQGSVYHRGTPEKPGRVLTLTKVPEGSCWGLVYEVRGSENINACLDKLCLREQSLGFYDCCVAPVYTRESESSGEPIHAIVYHAVPGNELFLGEESSLEEIALEIATCRGEAGHNLEYLLRLTDWLREEAPEETDPHVFGIESHVRRLLGLCNLHILSWTSLLEHHNFRDLVRGRRDLGTSLDAGISCAMKGLALVTDPAAVVEAINNALDDGEIDLDSDSEDLLLSSDTFSIASSSEDLSSSTEESESSDDELSSSEDYDELLQSSDGLHSPGFGSGANILSLRPHSSLWDRTRLIQQR